MARRQFLSKVIALPFLGMTARSSAVHEQTPQHHDEKCLGI
jgi:hypothetical protein